MVVIGLSIALLLYWSFANETILEVKNSPFPSRAISNEVDRYVVLEADYCKRVKADGRLRLSFVSSTREIFLPIVPERLPVGCQKTNYPIAIPKELPPDKYVVKFRVLYDLNPLKKNIPAEFESKEFTL